MPHNSKTTKVTAIASTLEAVSHQLTALREEMASLAETISEVAMRRGHNMATNVAEGLDEAKHQVVKTGRSAEARLEQSVGAHPFLTIGLAAGAGLLIGTMSRR